jgi:peptide/nickel transport system substrate-binding protein
MTNLNALVRAGQIRLGVVAAIGALALAACSSSSPPASTGPSGTLTVATAAVPTTVDPGFPLVAGYHYALQSVIGQLVEWPAGPSSHELAGLSNVQPELAKSWTRSSDGSYTFTLRSMKSSAGHQLTSADVLYSFQREQALTPIMNVILKAVNINYQNPITVIDDTHFTLNAAGNSPDILAGLPVTELGVLDSTAVKAHATTDDPWAKTWLTTNSASFGPYMVSSLTPNDTLTLKANPNYWRKSQGVPHFETVTLRQVSDPGTRASLIASGQVDAVTSVPFAQLKSLSGDKGVRVDAAPTLNNMLMALDDTKLPFSDPNVRRAMSMAIDRKALVQSGFGGYASAAYSLFPKTIPATHPSGESKYMNYDPTTAKSLLSQSGEPNGFSFQLTYSESDPNESELVNSAQIIQQDLGAIGVHVTLNPVTAAQASQGLHVYQATIASGIGPLVPDPGYYAHLEWFGPGSLIAPGYQNSEVTSLVTGLQNGTSTNRPSDIETVMSDLANDMPTLPLLEVPQTWVFANNVKGEYGNAAQGLYFEYMTRG